MIYNWQQPDWPRFTYDLSEITHDLFAFSQRVGLVSGMLEGLPDEVRTEAIIELMVSEAIKTSAIEGAYLSRNDVASSIRNNLGLTMPGEQVHDKRAEGAAELMIDVRDSWRETLSEEKLFTWHRMIMKGRSKIVSGIWRTHEEPMQIISGPAGREKIHFEAPPSERVPEEMTRFLEWFNATAPGAEKQIAEPVIRSAIAHLYFESIHPFEDGNGRIGRAIAEKALSQGAGRPILLSLSRAIEAKKSAYYQALQNAQQSNEITPWINWFVQMTITAQTHAEEQIDFTLKKARFFDRFEDQLNPRQLRVIGRMLQEGSGGFEGGMSAKKYIAITHISKATATRDMQELVDKGIFAPIGDGRSRRYEINLS